MNQQDKTYLENIYKVFFILPNDKLQYLMDVADGLAATVPHPPTGSAAPAAEQPRV